VARLLLEAEYDGVTLKIFGTIPQLPPHAASPTAHAQAQWVQPRIRNQPAAPSRPRPKQRVAIFHQSGSLVEVKDGTYEGPVLFESLSYDLYVESPDNDEIIEIRTDAPGVLEHIRRFAMPPSGSQSHYRIDFGDDVGIIALEVASLKGTLSRLELEVFPRKMDYRSDYANMLSEISSIAPALVFDAAGRTSISAVLRSSGLQTGAEWYEIFRAISAEFLRLIDLISRDPQRRLDLVWMRVPIERARRIRRIDLEAELKHQRAVTQAPEHLAIRMFPKHIVEQSAAPDFDAEGNRYLRWLLSQILTRLARLQLELNTAAQETRYYTKTRAALRERWFREIAWLRPQIQRRMSYEWISECNEPRNLTPSATLQVHPLYGRVFELGRCLLRGLRADNDKFTEIGSRSVSALYEYWCFLAIVGLIRRDAQLIQTTAIQVSLHGSRLSLLKGRETAVIFRHAKTGRQFQVYYNRQYETPTISQRPDSTLHIESDNGIHVFDAKYRLQFDKEYVKTYGAIGPRVDDISTMHRYRDAIVVAKGETYGRVVASACVLFPWDDLQGFKEHVFFHSLETVGVGGLPFLPGSTEMVANRLERIIRDAVKV
jgi:predicted component of viral defense system (DUF524 family)